MTTIVLFIGIAIGVVPGFLFGRRYALIEITRAEHWRRIQGLTQYRNRKRT